MRHKSLFNVIGSCSTGRTAQRACPNATSSSRLSARWQTRLSSHMLSHQPDPRALPPGNETAPMRVAPWPGNQMCLENHGASMPLQKGDVIQHSFQACSLAVPYAAQCVQVSNSDGEFRCKALIEPLLTAYPIACTTIVMRVCRCNRHCQYRNCHNTHKLPKYKHTEAPNGDRYQWMHVEC